MDSSLVLDVAEWAAVVGAPAERLGAAAELSAIPAQQRRRLPVFARDALQCALPLLEAEPASTMVFASVNGDLASTAQLLSDIAKGELLSPTLFALSVHNAPAGVLSLSVTGKGDHTAIAAGRETLSAALVEAYVRLAENPDLPLILVFAEGATPAIYAGYDEDGPAVTLALRLRVGVGAAEHAVSGGRAGALALVRALDSGARRIGFTAALAEAA